jgi:hypothetical protein
VDETKIFAALFQENVNPDDGDANGKIAASLPIADSKAVRLLVRKVF